MKVLVTGADGFIGKNLCFHLIEQNFQVLSFIRASDSDLLEEFVSQADAIVHLAGENRPVDPAEFRVSNVGLTKVICDLVRKFKKDVPIIFASSIQADLENPYGLSKLAAEDLLKNLKNDTGIKLSIYRLPGVFGKWCKPNYNSVVATFCNNIARDLPISISDPSTKLQLVYIDDVVESFIKFILKPDIFPDLYCNIEKQYEIRLGELADQIVSFKSVRENLVIEQVGNGLVRALYATYLSYLPTFDFSYSLPKYSDERGNFIEILKTKNSGQFSYFTAHPGMTRGGHYHHTKTEKFLVIRGEAKFKFKHIATKEIYELTANSDSLKVVDTIPGWSHDITNIGDDELIVLLWASEIFDHDRPDTYNVDLD